ncbi:uncharacterized protein LOC127852321 [Dreissena polymorpha]|uniref:uncharacterized protein LOC127852321 n=1 Tax=Dreissena polymorpha TaxID=45954 RepID=UPI0022651571|nr:uncharacterized protein LOC127852321 [Dreissena polymorpha]
MTSENIFHAVHDDVGVADHQYATELDPKSLDLIDIGSEVITGEISPQAVIIEEQVTSPRHHQGAISEDRISDKLARQKSFSKRMKTFKKQAMLLHTKCGASVRWEVISESGRIISGTHPMRTSRTVGLQAGQTAEETPSKSKSVGSPKRARPALMTRPDSQLLQINNLPGKKRSSSIVSNGQSKVTNKCSVCSIIFNSPKDRAFKKAHKLQGQWLGCEEEGCGFWGHARCAGVFIPSRKSIPEIKFHNKHP